MVHEQIGEQLKIELKGKRFNSEGALGVTDLKVGEYVLLRKPPASIKLEHGHSREDTVSTKLMPLTSSTIFEVYKITGASHVILCDPDTRSTDLGFSQPVAIERLVRYDLCNLEVPIEAERPVQIEIATGDHGHWRRGTITSWSGTGKIFVRFDGGEEQCLELADHEHFYA